MLPYLLILPALCCFLFALILLILRVLTSGFKYYWLLAAVGALLNWMALLLLRIVVPQTLDVSVWQPAALYTVSPTLLLDNASWAFALAVSTLTLSTILTGVSRAARSGWLAWASLLTFTGLGLLAILAGNLLTVLITWAAFDFFELCVRVISSQPGQVRSRSVATFAPRIASILLLVTAVLVESANSIPWTFQAITPQISLILLVAAFLRLVAYPYPLQDSTEPLLRRTIAASLSLTGAAASLILVTRCAAIGVLPQASTFLFGLAAITAVLTSLYWAAAPDEMAGQPYWIAGLALFSLAAAVRTQSAASLAWGIACILSGGLIYLFTMRTRFLLIFPFLGLLGISTLPITPAWQAVRLYTPPFSVFFPFFILAQSIFMLGYVRHSLHERPSLTGMERWVWLIYPWGLAYLVLAAYLIAWAIRSTPYSPGWPTLISSWSGLVATLLAGLWVFLAWRGFKVPQTWSHRLSGILRLDPLYHFLQAAFHSLSQVTAFVNTILEGEGGLLWTILLLTLLLSLLAVAGQGG